MTDHVPEPGRTSFDPAQLIDLVRRTAAGDRVAFTHLYALTSNHVFGVAFRVLRTTDLSAEVCQEVYLELWSRLAARYDPSRGSVVTWLTLLARRRAIDRVRSVHTAGVRDQRYTDIHRPLETDEVWEAVGVGVTCSLVHAALSQLNPLHRDTLILFYLGGQTQREIAHRLQIPLGTAKTRIRNGLAQLRLLIPAEAVDLL